MDRSTHGQEEEAEVAHTYLGIILIVAENDFRGHVDWRPHPSFCAGVHFMLGIAKVRNLEQGAFASLPVQQ